MKDVGVKIDEEAWEAMAKFGEQMKRLQAEHPWMFVTTQVEWKLKIRFSFAWWDMWVGAYYSRFTRTLYICPLPCCVISIRNEWDTIYPAPPDGKKKLRITRR